MVPVVMPTNDAQVPASRVVNSREELRQKITLFNNNTQGYIMSLVSRFFMPPPDIRCGRYSVFGLPVREKKNARATVIIY